MDSRGHIYIDEKSKIPAEDIARLDGYLRGRAEADVKARFEAQAAKLEQELARARSVTKDPRRSRP